VKVSKKIKATNIWRQKEYILNKNRASICIAMKAYVCNDKSGLIVESPQK
jgi:hypothetical protein